jgi:DNA-binding ferritin-like protein (Dps family)
MTMSDTEKGFVAKVIGPKKRWRAYKARVRQLPENYRTVAAIERYLNYCGGLVDAASAESLMDDLADLFERAAADGTPIREIVGDDPVEFVEALVRNYEQGGYIKRERERLINAVNHAAGDDTGKGERMV